MIPVTEFHRRAMTGPVTKDAEFDKALARKLREIVARYDIRYDPESVIADEPLADAVFQGGVDLLAEAGIYHKETQRVIKLSKEEVLQIARDSWESVRTETFGKGENAVTVQYRTAEDPRPPSVFLGTMSTPSTEELYIPWLQSFAQEELSDGMTSFGTLLSAGGIQNKIGTPGEMVCSLAEVKSVQEAARRAGRPDMFFGLSSATTSAAIMALLLPGGLERHNTMLPLFMNNELKVDSNVLMLALCAQEHGLLLFTGASSTLGALCRGPEDTAVMLVACLLSELGYGHGTFASVTVNNWDGTKDRDTIRALSAAIRASERHIGIPLGAGMGSAAGAGTEMALYEKAAVALGYTASGSAYIRGADCGKRAAPNSNTGLDARIVAETARAVAGMPRDKANEVLKKVLDLFEDQLHSPPEGKLFQELYDVKTVQPTEEYLAVYGRAKERMAALGIPYR